ncbi:MAG: hypothetical protein R3E93_06320 [Thiothrix sp.]
MALRLKLKLTGCDVDATFWQAMSRLVSAEGEEAFIHTNWLELSPDHPVQFIIGDCPEHVDMGRNPGAGSQAAGLKSHGQMILRLQSANRQLTMDTLKQAITDYSHGSEQGVRFLRIALSFRVAKKHSFP